jgi:hypothetical protein
MTAPAPTVNKAQTQTIASLSEVVSEFASFGIRAFTTTRAVGTFGLHGDEPVRAVMGRWHALRAELRSRADAGGGRFATAGQVHGTRVLVHRAGWEGWLRSDDADGHVSIDRVTGLAVTVADCVPVFIAHPSGAIALLHSGWRGTAGRIVERGIDELVRAGCATRDLRVHLGPAICGQCYEVSAEVYAQLTGKSVAAPTTIDLRMLIADHARARGVEHVTTSSSCTRCDNAQFFSHRAGDAGRQLGVMIADA